MFCLSTIDPDRSCVVDSDLENEFAFNLGWLETGEDATVGFDWYTRGSERRLNDGMVHWEVVKVDLVARIGGHNVWSEHEATFTDIDVDSLG